MTYPIYLHNRRGMRNPDLNFCMKFSLELSKKHSRKRYRVVSSIHFSPFCNISCESNLICYWNTLSPVRHYKRPLEISIFENIVDIGENNGFSPFPKVFSTL